MEPQPKQCSRCKRMLTATTADFSPNRGAPDGLRYVCKDCDTETHRLYYSENPSKYRARSVVNREYAKQNNLCRVCRNPLDGSAKTLCVSCAQKNRERTMRNRNRVKDACYGAYGGYRCVCCGETEKAFLCLDHIKGGGNIDRRKQFGSVTPGSGKLYRWLIANGFPAGYQVLCASCNVGKSRNGGICPHEQKPKRKAKRNSQHPIDALLSKFDNEGKIQ